MNPALGWLIAAVFVIAMIWLIWELVIKRVVHAGEAAVGAVKDREKRQAAEASSQSLLDEQLRKYGDRTPRNPPPEKT